MVGKDKTMRVTGNPNVTHFTTLEFHGLPSDKPVLSPTNALRFPLPVVMLPEEGTGFHTKSLSIAYLLNEEARGAGLGHFKTVSGWSPSYDRLQAKPLPDLVVSVDSWHPDETQRHKERNHYNRLRSTLMLMDPPRTKTVLPIWFGPHGQAIGWHYTFTMTGKDQARKPMFQTQQIPTHDAVKEGILLATNKDEVIVSWVSEWYTIRRLTKGNFFKHREQWRKTYRITGGWRAVYQKIAQMFSDKKAGRCAIFTKSLLDQFSRLREPDSDDSDDDDTSKEDDDSGDEDNDTSKEDDDSGDEDNDNEGGGGDDEGEEARDSRKRRNAAGIGSSNKGKGKAVINLEGEEESSRNRLVSEEFLGDERPRLASSQPGEDSPDVANGQGIVERSVRPGAYSTRSITAMAGAEGVEPAAARRRLVGYEGLEGILEPEGSSDVEMS